MVPMRRAAAYAHPAYATSLAEQGEALDLPRCGGHLIRRAIPGAAAHDASGPYPLLACSDWSALEDDLAGLRGLASVVAVPDPLTAPGDGELRRAFRDLVRPFKLHHVADLGVPAARRTSEHHLRELRKVPASLRVERVERPADELEAWCGLYGALVRSRGIRGASRFSRESFRRQFAVPGLSAYAATLEGVVVAMALWFDDGEHAWYHLAAADAAGRRSGASYAIVARALDDLADGGVRLADLGGAAGLVDDPADGLARFKRGWATGTRVAHLCGRILDPGLYARLVLERPGSGDDHFPAYRRGDVAR